LLSAPGIAMVIGLLGAMVGSFLNVVIHRVPLGESIVTPRSRCPGCGTQIASRDNLPVVSWLLLRGKCRTCAEPISVRYPVVEALTAVTFLAVGLARGIDSDLAFELPFAAMLIAVAGIDIDHRIVPNKILLPMAGWGLAASAVLRPGELPELAIAGAVAFLFLLVAALLRPGGMGMGDVKLAGVMGLYLGASVAPAMLVAFAVGPGWESQSWPAMGQVRASAECPSRRSWPSAVSWACSRAPS